MSNTSILLQIQEDFLLEHECMIIYTLTD